MDLHLSTSRWQPPPLESAPPTTRVTVDEKVVRKLLAVNPAMRQGRTTFQVKRALERGEALSVTAATAPGTDTAIAAAGERTAPRTTRQSLADRRREVEETLDFFLRGKAERFAHRRAELEGQRRALAEAEAHARAEVAAQLTAFVALLDEASLALVGRSALTAHTAFLEEVGLTIHALLAAGRQGQR